MLPKPERVYLTEVGMRDGFQMESRFVPTDIKVEIGAKLIESGIRELEVTSFVSPKHVSQLSDAADVVRRLRGRGATLRALTPNRRGAERAVEAGVDTMVAFVSASETHNRRNVNRSVAESLGSIAEIAAIAKSSGTGFDGAIATAFGCPFEGEVGVAKPLAIARAFAELGANSVSLGDTTGMATPPTLQRLCEAIRTELPNLNLRLHFHNTRGIAMANALTGLELGVNYYESSIGGLGGCPFAVGATGNICTEDLIYLFEELGIATHIDLAAVIDVAKRVEAFFGRALPGQVMKAGPRLALHD
jgi:hydroxymethylglutaryl-CoA lyase